MFMKTLCSRYSVITLIALLLSLSGAAFAVDSPADEPTPATDESADKSTPATDESDAPTLPTVEVETTQADRSKTVTVITREDTEGVHFTNINDALFSGTPGVATSRRSETGFGGPNSGFLIRGLQGPRVPVFVDGIPIQINNHFHARVDRYSSDMVDSMEITRGPSVLKHGASAVGGVIDIYTRVPGKGASGFIQAATGRYDTTEIFGDVGYGWDGGSVLVSASDRITDGRTPINGFDAGIPFAEGHALKNYNFKVNQAINDIWSVGLRYGADDEDSIDRLDFVPGYPYFRFGSKERDIVLSLDRKTATSNTLIAYHDNELKNFDGTVTDGILDPMSVSSSFNTEKGILGRHTWQRSGGNSTTVGVHAVKYFNDFDGVENSRHVSTYVQTSEGIGDSIRVDGGVRVTVGKDFDTDISPEFGIVKKIDPSLAVRGRLGKAFRVPRVGDVDASGAILDPEDFTHAEIGANKLFGHGGVADIAVWVMDGDNLIECFGRRGAPPCANSDEFSNKGVEASVTYPLTSAVSVFAGATVMSLETTGPSPQRIFDLGLEYRKGPFRANLTVRDASNNADPRLSNEDYTVADARIQYAVTRNATVFVDIDNITGTNYATRSSGPGAGAPNYQVQELVMVGFRLSFGR